MATAEALAVLRSDEFRTTAGVANAVGVSAEIVREFLSLLRLPTRVQDMFRTGALTTLEQGRRLEQLQRRRPGIVEETATLMVGRTAHESRALVDYLLRHPEADPGQAAAAVEESRTTVRREFHVIAELDEQSFRAVSRAARKRRTEVTALVSAIVKEWLTNAKGG